MVLNDYKNEKFDIIIQAGQSNAEGFGYGDIADPFKPDDRIISMNHDFYVEKAVESGNEDKVFGNFVLPFADLYIKEGFLDPDRKVLILKAAVGGTGFSDNRWKAGDDLYENLFKMTEAAIKLNPENRAVVFLWHQGETDASHCASYEYYLNHFSALIKNLRNKLIELSGDNNYENMPFIAADFVQQWKNENFDVCKPVIQAQRDICGKAGGCFVETTGLKSNLEENGIQTPPDEGDIVHFSRNSLYILGKMYFEAYKCC